MKAIILVQSVTMDRYPELIKVQQETWDSVEHPDIKVYYYYPNTSGKYGIDGRNISTPGSEHWTYMFIDLARTFREIMHLEWDFIVKTDNSAYINKEELAKLLSTKSKTGYYGGHRFPKKDELFNIDFLWGECFVLSRDLVMHLIDQYALNPTRRLGSDDVHVAQILQNKCEQDTFLEIYEYYKNSGSIPIRHAYRCKNDSGDAIQYDDEIKAMKSIHESLTFL